jgi:hypothetical protein
MLGLSLRDEFRGVRLRGTTIDFTNEAKTGALDQSAKDFLCVTYPSADLLKTLEAAAFASNRAVVLSGDRGQGKSHLLAALYHLLSDPGAGTLWLRDWAARLARPQLANLALPLARYAGPRHIIAEPLHERRFTHLWDLLFARHPNGERARALWLQRKSEVPGKDLLVEMFTRTPCALLLDEFQTWFDGLSNSIEPRQHWAFNFIQILSEIAQHNPELLALVVSVRDAGSNAAQQLFRVNPVRVDFKGEQSQRDRRSLLLHRIFVNRGDIEDSQIASLLRVHLAELARLRQIPASQFARHEHHFLEAWPYSPELLQLLDDAAMPTSQSQGTRDQIRALVELFKAAGETVPVITPADFDLTFIDDQEQLRDKALRNIAAVEDALGGDASRVPHLREILASVLLRSLSSDPQRVGADPETVQLDVTRAVKQDDNAFRAELATIEANSYNIHRVGSRLVLKPEENPRTRLMAHARGNRSFQNSEDVDFLGAQIRQLLNGGSLYQTIVLGRGWRARPWDEPPWDDRKIPLIVLPEYPDNLHATLGGWLKEHLRTGRNSVRFLLPCKDVGGASDIYLDPELMLAARAACLASNWSQSDLVYRSLASELTGALQARLADRFDRFAILSVWNHEDPAKCIFSIEPHGAQGATIPAAIQDKIKRDLFADEEFDELIAGFAHLSMAKLLAELREPRRGGARCIPWLGEADVRRRLEELELAHRDSSHIASTPPTPRASNTGTTRLSSEATSGLNLLSRVVDVWGVEPSTSLSNASIRIDRLTGAQLRQLIQDLPDGPSYGLEADREDPPPRLDGPNGER